MIPTTSQNQLLERDFEITAPPSHTYKLNREKARAVDYTDGLEAVKQAVYKILLTEGYV